MSQHLRARSASSYHMVTGTHRLRWGRPKTETSSVAPTLKGKKREPPSLASIPIPVGQTFRLTLAWRPDAKPCRPCRTLPRIPWTRTASAETWSPPTHPPVDMDREVMHQVQHTAREPSRSRMRGGGIFVTCLINPRTTSITLDCWLARDFKQQSASNPNRINKAARTISGNTNTRHAPSSWRRAQPRSKAARVPPAQGPP